MEIFADNSFNKFKRETPKLILELMFGLHIKFALLFDKNEKPESGKTFHCSNVEFPNNTVFLFPLSELLRRGKHNQRKLSAWLSNTFNATRARISCECVREGVAYNTTEAMLVNHTFDMLPDHAKTTDRKLFANA